jgi:two-component sensor histidine kinase
MPTIATCARVNRTCKAPIREIIYGCSRGAGEECAAVMTHHCATPIDLGRTDQGVFASEGSDKTRLLLREFSHRINNEFASAIAMISIAARSANDEARAALTAVEDQLQNFARVHHALQMPEHTSLIDAAAYLRQLCRAISRSKLEHKGIELRLVERAFHMSSERCWRLALILSELIANAERHAFRNRGGWIHVELLPSLSFVECRVTDNGSSEANTIPGHGLKIVEALARSLGGTIDQRFGPRGATAVLIFPAEVDTTERLA